MRIIKLLLFCTLLLTTQHRLYAQQVHCETQTSKALLLLPDLLEKNDFTGIDALMDTLHAHCGETELALRLGIIGALIAQEPTASLIQQYQNLQFDHQLVHRYDYASQSNFAKHYQNRKAQFDFVPLRHAVDSLIQIKASALLQSNSYTLNHQEEAICLLFSDQIDLYYQMLNRNPPARPFVDKIREREDGKYKTAGVLYAGAFFPLGSNEYLQTSPTFGFTIMSPLYRPFVFELGVKLRINSKNAPFDFRDDGHIKEIHARSSYFLGANLGYKALDRGPWIILPKVGLGLGFINTKLSTTTIYDAMWDYEDSGSGIQYNNANTLHSVAGIALMRHIKKKMYVGLELNYHLVPYNWDKDLITKMNDQFSSVELFLRF